MCRSSHRCFDRQQKQFKNESEQVEQSEAIIDSEDYQTVYIEDFTDTDVERLEEGDVEGDPETCLEVSHIESEEEGEDVISELDEKYSKDDIKTIVPMETPVKVLDTHDFHDIPSNLVCDDCNKSFGTMKSYRTHVLLIHSDNDIQSQEHLFKVKKRDIYTDADYDDLTCEYCFDKFNNPEQRKDHETSHLEEDRPYRCNVCTQQFPTRTTLRGHYESHMNLTWSCSYEGCEKTFKTKHGRWTHEYKHKNASRPCPVCGKLLKTTWAINQHIKQMHTELPLVHECAKCSKKFKTQKALYNHAIIHDENKRTHECRICKKRFFTKSKLTRHHDQVHSGKKVGPVSNDTKIGFFN